MSYLNGLIKTIVRRSCRSRALHRSVPGVPLLLICISVLPTANAAITYIQGTSETGGTGTAVNVTYPSVQNAGDLDVVVIAWACSTPSVQSVTDSNGNTYAAAGGPTRDGGLAAQQIYYAKNIARAAADTNIVTVTFNEAITDSDIRIVE